MFVQVFFVCMHTLCMFKQAFLAPGYIYSVDIRDRLISRLWLVFQLFVAEGTLGGVKFMCV